MAIDVNKFLVSLMAVIASRSSLTWIGSTPTSTRSLWLHEADAQLAADPSTIIRPYGGASPAAWAQVRKLALSLQVMTRGSDSPSVMAQAWKVHEAMLSDSDLPLTHYAVTGKTLSVVAGAWTLATDSAQDWEIVLAMPLQTPGILGRTEDGKWMASCNWDVEFLKKPKS